MNNCNYTWIVYFSFFELRDVIKLKFLWSSVSSMSYKSFAVFEKIIFLKSVNLLQVFF